MMIAMLCTVLLVAPTLVQGNAASKVGLTLLGSASVPYAEQVAYDDAAKVAYVIGDTTLSVIDMSHAALLNGTGSGPAGASLPILKSINFGKSVNDVVFCDSWVALAMNGAAKTDPGSVTLHRRYDPANAAASLELLATFTVGSQPDQIEFAKQCRIMLVSNEAEPSGYGTGYVDPEGSVNIIRIKDIGGTITGKVCTADFKAWNGKEAELLAQGIKINGPGSTVAQDLEPECTTFSEDQRTAFVSLQENNAIAILDVKTCTIKSISPLGLKDHSAPANKMDPSDRDTTINGGINIASWPVHGMYMPDEIKSFRVAGVDYVVTANEGDGREWPGLTEEGKVTAAVLNTTVFPNAAALANQAALGRLTIVGVLNKINDPDSDGKMDKILSYGARSFSIWELNSGTKQLSLVYDSGSMLEDIAARDLPTLFNSEGTTATFDRRSDNKGPEPEGLAIGACIQNSSRRCLFLTTERLGAVFVFDITDPRAPQYQSLVLPPQSSATDETTRFKGPEGIAYASYLLPVRGRFPIVLVAYEGANGLNSGIGVYRVGNI